VVLRYTESIPIFDQLFVYTNIMQHSRPATSAPQSVERIFSVLDCLSVRAAGETLSGLAKEVSAPKTSLLGLLAGMLERGVLLRDESNRYSLGPRMQELASRIVARRGLAEIAHPVLVNLARETGETALLGTLEPQGDRASYIDKVESANPIRYTVPLGTRRVLYASAIGKLLLAHQPAERIDAYLTNFRLEPLGHRTITRPEALRAELQRTREAGLSRTEDEAVEGAAAFAAPVFDGLGRVVAGVVVAGPTGRMRAQSTAIELAIREAASTLSRALGMPVDSSRQLLPAPTNRGDRHATEEVRGLSDR
jgi:IclR family acetate operon transcriptional repressor